MLRMELGGGITASQAWGSLSAQDRQGSGFERVNAGQFEHFNLREHLSHTKLQLFHGRRKLYRCCGKRRLRLQCLPLAALRQPVGPNLRRMGCCELRLVKENHHKRRSRK